MAPDIRDFLKGFSVDELAEKGVLRGQTGLLNHRSVSPLLKLMSDQGVTQLDAADRGWFLSATGEFRNPLSDEAKSGLVADLDNPGNVFNYQNVELNPHYEGGTSTDQAGDASAQDDETAADLKFGLERDLQHALRSNIEQLESGLKIVDGGKERVVEAGKIDVTARDADGRLVVIELKAGTARAARTCHPNPMFAGS
ncbi:MAG: endonuclease NucS [Chloroflexi bacterium]|nr:endonuclease NucS [Chloroflexota bacterium]